MENVNKQLLDSLKGLLELHDNPAPFSGKTGEERMLAIESQAAKRNALIDSARQAIAAAEQAQQAAPAALPLPFFAYDSETGFERFATEAEAKQYVQDGIDECRSNMLQGEAWPSEIESLCWGVVLGGTKEIKLGDAGDGSGDYYSDYVLTDAAQPPAVAEGCGACGDGCKGQGCRLERESPPTCQTCNGQGMVGGLLPNGGGYDGQPCPDCATPKAAVAVPDAAKLLAAIEYAERMLTNLQPHIPQASHPQRMAFVDNYVDPVLERLRAEIAAAQKGGPQ